MSFFERCELPEYSIRSLSLVNSDEILSFLIENREYFHLENGRPPAADDGRSFIEDLPPNKNPSDKFALSIDHGDRIIGLVDIVRGYPEDDIWWIGLLIIHPSFRGAGLGIRICRLIDEAVFASGGKEIRLGVLAENCPGLNFWKRAGYAQIGTKRGQVIGEKTHTVYVMAKQLEQSANEKQAIC